MAKLFGTDGIRGKAGSFPLDEKTVWVIGRSLTDYFKAQGRSRPRFIIGRDTRESGPVIESAFAGGALSAGAECETAGVITTPGVAYLTKAGDFDAGIVISASHNPFHDNGLKLFARSGKKLGREVEEIIESSIKSSQQDEFAAVELDPARAESHQENYISHFAKDFEGLHLRGIKMVVDCANGAASGLAPRLLGELNADVVPINDKPDGRNINRDCGSLHLEGLTTAVLEERADLGVAFDGDADRALFVDEKGGLVDGDATLWIMANHLRALKKLNKNSVVATVMSNIGLEIALERISVSLIRTDVGDKYVLAELIKSGLSLGGEQSGHIIFPERTLVGDGIQTTLYLLEAGIAASRSISELKSGFVTYPQILENVRVSQKVPFDEFPEISAASADVEGELGGDGRLLLRYSGTENLARIMIEGKDQAKIETMAGNLASVIESVLGEQRTVPHD